MDRLIKQALEERATEVELPNDAWERQRALLAAAGTTERREGVRVGGVTGKPGGRPWWQRWVAMVEVAAFLFFVTGLFTVLTAQSPTRPGGGEERPAPVAAPLNPVVSPPSPQVVVAPDLPVLTPPEGSLTQEAIITTGIVAAAKGVGIQGGQLTLIRVDLADDRWLLEFRGDGRAFTFSGGPRPHDPRKDAYSHVVLVEQLTYEIDAGSGEILSVRTNGGAPLVPPTGLEHYRGYIVQGGEQTTLRLIRADGGREGRDLVVWIAAQALRESGVDLWHLNYGTGRLIDVWGLTTAPGEVLAYRVEMKERPGEELLDHDLIHGIPLPNGAKVTKAIDRDGAGYTLEGQTVESLKAWYLEQMPRYGWQEGQLKFSNGESRVLRFVAFGWQWAEVGILPDPKGVQFTLSWGMTRLGNVEQAVSAVFREVGDNPTFAAFPRTVGAADGEINIGGPSPGVTIPATFETRVRTYEDGAWQVDLYRSWGEGLHTTWSFRVEQDGTVHRLGQSGDQPPAIR